jgi:HK97 family phage prohead protease
MERRTQVYHEIEVRDQGKELRVSGYAAKYGVISHNLGGFREQIAQGAFDRILGTNPDVLMNFNHDEKGVPLGRTASGTLELRADGRGLAFDCLLPNTQTARDLHTAIKRGDVNGCSFAFTIAEGGEEWGQTSDTDDWEIAGRSYDKIPLRTIKDFSRLHDVSVVTHAAYPKTEVNARADVVSAEVRSYVQALKSPTRRRLSLLETIDEVWHVLTPAERRCVTNTLIGVDRYSAACAAIVQRRRRQVLEFLL